MDLSLTQEQTLIRNTARDFLSHECPLIGFVRPVDDSDTGFSAELWRKMAELGWAGMGVPAEYGGSGSSLTDVAVLFEELGYHCISSPLHSSAVLAGGAILEAGSEQQKRDLLPAIAGGSRIVAFAFSEPDYGWSPGKVKLAATRQEGGYLLNGIKLFVPDIQVADQVLVVARTGNWTETDITMFLLDANTQGLSHRTIKGWTGDKMNEVVFDNVFAPDSSVIGEVDAAWAPLRRVFDRGSILLSAYMVGGMQRVFEMTNDFSQRRIHYGVPIATFQRIQDYVVEILNLTDAARWTTYEALWKYDSGHPDASESISMAKTVTSEGYPKSAQDAHHVHAGTGGDRDYGLYLYTKKAKQLHSYLGEPAYHKIRVAQALGI